jgi:hypothetical protein
MATSLVTPLASPLQSTLVSVSDLDNTLITAITGGPTKLLSVDINNTVGSSYYVGIADSAVSAGSPPDDAAMYIRVAASTRFTMTIDIGEKMDTGVTVWASGNPAGDALAAVSSGLDIFVVATST